MLDHNVNPESVEFAPLYLPEGFVEVKVPVFMANPRKADKVSPCRLSPSLVRVCWGAMVVVVGGCVC